MELPNPRAGRQEKTQQVVFRLAKIRLALRAARAGIVHTLSPQQQVQLLLQDIVTLFVKGEGHNSSKITTGQWKLIWNISQIDRLCDTWDHSDQDHYDVAYDQRDKGESSPFIATGVGHDDASIEKTCRDLKWLKGRTPDRG